MPRVKYTAAVKRKRKKEMRSDLTQRASSICPQGRLVNQMRGYLC